MDRKKLRKKISKKILPNRRSKNNLPDDVKLNFVKTTLMMNCIDYYERAIIDEDEFIKRIRQIENQYK